jgi:catechol 2,3-dioxygenase-like lactoylglutathione lyase family enzyme
MQHYLAASGSVFPGEVRQLGFIVPDIDAAIAQWANLGVGPWLAMREMPLAGNYRGTPSEPTISVALANTGDMQIELMQQHCDTPSIYQEFMSATGGGFNQVAYWVEDFAAARNAALADGWTEVWSGDAGGQANFSYLERADAPVAIVELTEYNALSRSVNDAIRAAAATWKPGEPIFMSL